MYSDALRSQNLLLLLRFSLIVWSYALDPTIQHPQALTLSAIDPTHKHMQEFKQLTASQQDQRRLFRCKAKLSENLDV